MAEFHRVGKSALKRRGKLLTLLLVGASVLSFFTCISSAPQHSLAATTITIPDPREFDKIVERAGGTRVVVGAAAAGAIAGTIVTAPLPVLNQFGAPLGAAASVYMAQLPKDDTPLGKAGEFCRDVGKAATAFWTVLRKEMKDNK
eukprot:TRINITY_DN11462_c0_g1_i1.p1 TRINITY_DN11462_c0_g1~~TRINITY_DN11462_c0_g1_i1.p1  ORF type:complete len:145 (+),score=29.16 TRINITY_DN11462_c0_g1_i1:62-496(+)